MGLQRETRRMGQLQLVFWKKRYTLKHPMMNRGREARRILIVPGFCDGPVSWIQTIAILSPIFRKYADELWLMEYPGFLGSIFDQTPYHSFELLVSHFTDALKSIRPQIAMGQSLGAWLLCLGCSKLHENQKPQHLVLMTPPGLFANELQKKEWKELFERVVQNGFREWRPYIFGKEPFWFRWVVPQLQNLLHQDELKQFLTSVSDDFLLKPFLSELPSKTDLIWGELDQLVSPRTLAEEWVHELREVGKNPTSVILSRTGHTLHVESPFQTARTIGRFIRHSSLT